MPLLANLFQLQCPWSYSLCGFLKLNPNGSWELRMRSPASLAFPFGKVWRQWCWCSGVLPMSCLFQPQCSWNCSLCNFVISNPNPNDSSGLRLRCPASWVSQITKGWTTRMPFPPQGSWSCGLCGSLNPNPHGSVAELPSSTGGPFCKACALWLVQDAEWGNALRQHCSLQTFLTSASRVPGYLSLKLKILAINHG